MRLDTVPFVIGCPKSNDTRTNTGFQHPSYMPPNEDCSGRRVRS